MGRLQKDVLGTKLFFFSDFHMDCLIERHVSLVYVVVLAAMSQWDKKSICQSQILKVVLLKNVREVYRPNVKL